MRLRDTILIVFSVLAFIFSFFIIFATLYRSSLMMNEYFPGFFVYHTRVINIYDIPEWWSGKTHNLPKSAILLKLNDQEINSPSDFWREVFNNLDREVEFKVEYNFNGDKFIKFIKSQRFEIKDFIFFTLFWQISGLLLLLLGFVMFLSNRSKKGVLWLIANMLTGINFITTPSSSLLSDVLVITLVERLTFSMFPVSMVWLFLNFPLVKFKKQVRLVIISVVSGIGLSFILVSLMGYTNDINTIMFQEMYYFYPAIGGIFAVISPIYDYIRARRHRIHNLSKSLLPLMVGSLIFILIPSSLAVLTTFTPLPSYYIPLLIVGYPLVVIFTLMVSTVSFVKEVSINLSIIILISFIFTFVYVLLHDLFTLIPKGLFFTIFTPTFSVVSIIVFSIFMRHVSMRKYGFNKELILEIVDKLKMVDRFGKFIIFVNSQLGKILRFSFSRFVSYKLIPKDVRKTLFLSDRYFMTKKEVQDCCKYDEIEKFSEVMENSKYVIVLKNDTKFFGIIVLGKEQGGAVLSSKEIDVLEVVSRFMDAYLNSLIKHISQRPNKSILEKKPYLVSNLLIKSIPIHDIHRSSFRVRSYLNGNLDKPVVYKSKETHNGLFFCIVWIVPESIHTFVLASSIKGFLEEYFFRGNININKLPREIRNLIYLSSPVEVDANIVCGFVKDSMSMNVVNDGKSSILLVTKYNSVIPMPIHKRVFNFNKIKDGDSFYFITGEEISTQFHEIIEMGVKKLSPHKLIRNLPDKFILEVKFHGTAVQ